MGRGSASSFNDATRTDAHIVAIDPEKNESSGGNGGSGNGRGEQQVSRSPGRRAWERWRHDPCHPGSHYRPPFRRPISRHRWDDEAMEYVRKMPGFLDPLPYVHVCHWSHP